CAQDARLRRRAEAGAEGIRAADPPPGGGAGRRHHYPGPQRPRVQGAVRGAVCEVVQVAKAVIRRRSVTPDGARGQALIAERLARCGFACEHLRFGEVDNLWATHGSGDGPVLVLLGHTDVVPPGPREAWASDPFVPEVRDGVLYGRGAADMKGSVAA